MGRLNLTILSALLCASTLACDATLEAPPTAASVDAGGTNASATQASTSSVVSERPTSTAFPPAECRVEGAAEPSRDRIELDSQRRDDDTLDVTELPDATSFRDHSALFAADPASTADRPVPADRDDQLGRILAARESGDRDLVRELIQEAEAQAAPERR